MSSDELPISHGGGAKHADGGCLIPGGASRAIVRPMRLALAAGVASAITAISLARSAEASGPAFGLDYEAPPVCPTEASFVSDVHARVADLPAAAKDERRFRVRIVAGSGASYSGALEILDPPSVREVHGETCEEVVRALVVFVALALTPGAADVSPEAGPLPEEKKAPSVPPLSHAPPSPRAPRSTRETPGAKRPARPPFLGVDVRGLGAAGVTPGLAPGGAVAGRLTLQGRPASLRWVIHAGGIAAYREEPVLAGSFSFLWLAARVDAGPALDLGAVRVSAGPVLRAGLLSVEARDLPSAGRYSSFWGDLGGFVRVDRALTESISVSLMLELAAPLQRRTFGISGIDEPVHEVAPVIGVASLGFTLGQ